MLDARFVRENPDAARKAMADRGSAWSVDAFLSLDEERTLETVGVLDEAGPEQPTA